MYERFTDRARKVMQLANQEAQRFNHEYIGAEHILLGLVKEGSGVAATVLKNLGADLRRIRQEVETIVQAGPDMVAMGRLPHTPRAKTVIEYAIMEARAFAHRYVGTEHLLLGMLLEEQGVAAQVLMNLGMKLDEVRAEVLDLLGNGPGDPPPRATDRWLVLLSRLRNWLWGERRAKFAALLAPEGLGEPTPSDPSSPQSVLEAELLRMSNAEKLHLLEMIAVAIDTAPSSPAPDADAARDRELAAALRAAVERRRPA